MAKSPCVFPIESLHGKLSSKSNTYFRYVNGKQFTVTMENPRQEFSEKEKVLHRTYGELSRLASYVAHTPSAGEFYRADFEAQKINENGQTSFYRYVLRRWLTEAGSERENKLQALKTQLLGSPDVDIPAFEN